MFDKLISFILDQIQFALPIYFVYQYHRGCRYRGGKFIEELQPGIHLKIPWFDRILVESYVDTTILLPAQSIITKDGKGIVVRGTIGYKIVSVSKYFNNVYDTKSAISDNGCLVIRQLFAINTFEDAKDVGYGVILKKLLQREVRNYGIKINFFGLIDISESRSYRLFNENIKLES